MVHIGVESGFAVGQIAHKERRFRLAFVGRRLESFSFFAEVRLVSRKLLAFGL